MDVVDDAAWHRFESWADPTNRPEPKPACTRPVLTVRHFGILLHWKSKYWWFSAGSLKAGRSCAGLEVA